MFDVDKFIKCIHNNNAIWETSSKQYMDKNMKTQSWVNVGQAVYEDWDELSTTEKDDRGKVLYILVPILIPLTKLVNTLILYLPIYSS